MGKGLKKVYLKSFSVIFGLNILLINSLYSNENPTPKNHPSLSVVKSIGQMPRRSFLKGFFGSATAAALTSTPMAILSSAADKKLPDFLKKILVKKRLSLMSEVAPELPGDLRPSDPFVGLRNYLRFLEDVIKDPAFADYKSTLMGKLKSSEQALVIFEDVYARGLRQISTELNSSEKTTADSSSSSKKTSLNQKNASQPDEAKNTSVTEADFFEELRKQEKDQLIETIRRSPMEIRIILIRSLLGPRLLRKMQWQVHYADSDLYSVPNLILSKSEIRHVMEYYVFLHETWDLSKKGDIQYRSDFVSGSYKNLYEGFLSQYIDEARDVVLAHHRALKIHKERLKNLNMCSNYL